MYVMGTNTWEFDGDTDFLVEQALEFSEQVKANGIAELRDACIAPDQKLLWCSWETEDLEGLQAAFDEMNAMTGLSSELTEVEIMYPK
jgi:hypothetical protein